MTPRRKIRHIIITCQVIDKYFQVRKKMSVNMRVYNEKEKIEKWGKEKIGCIQYMNRKEKN